MEEEDKMKKMIAICDFSIDNTLKEFLGDYDTYISPSGNRFYDVQEDIELCVFSNGRISLCGLGEHKRIFSGPADFRAFVKEKMR